MEKKFTEGEWMDLGYCVAVELADGISNICEMADWVGEDKMEANAKLIAAAPKLLEALINIVNIINDSEGVSGYHLNGDIAKWDEFEEKSLAIEAIKEATE